MRFEDLEIGNYFRFPYEEKTEIDWVYQKVSSTEYNCPEKDLMRPCRWGQPHVDYLVKVESVVIPECKL